jgi:hypothetical protein
MHKPIENCYWVVPGMFLAGEYPRDMDEESSRVKINALIHSGITVFIDLTDKNDNLLPYSFLLETAIHLRFPIRDTSIPDSPDVTAAILDTIDHHIEQGGMVYISPLLGRNRANRNDCRMLVGTGMASQTKPPLSDCVNFGNTVSSQSIGCRLKQRSRNSTSRAGRKRDDFDADALPGMPSRAGTRAPVLCRRSPQGHRKIRRKIPDNPRRPHRHRRLPIILQP